VVGLVGVGVWFVVCGVVDVYVCGSVVVGGGGFRGGLITYKKLTHVRELELFKRLVNGWNSLFIC